MSSHYEALIEDLLRKNEVLYIAINERKRPIYGGKRIKNFDFIISSFNGKYLVDIKGKTFPYGQSGRWENWVTIDDISGLKLWATHFNAFTPLLVFTYLIKDRKYHSEFKDLYNFKRKCYGVVAIELGDYYSNAKPRSRGWHAIYVSGNTFKNIVKPVSYFIPEFKKKW